jgi:Spy/CpxP family protein refolding chaperone
MVGVGGRIAVTTDRPRALVVLIVVFLLGGIIGSAGSYYWLRTSADSRIRGRESPRSFSPERQRLSDLLQLTRDQQTKVKEIIAESRRQLNALQIERAPKIEAIQSETNRKILAILTEEQQKKFAAFLKETESRRKNSPRRRG